MLENLLTNSHHLLTQPRPSPIVSGLRFERKNALVAQLDRVLGYEPSGRWFESTRVHQSSKPHLKRVGFFAFNGIR